MPVQTAYVVCAPSTWVQICEYRESRQSLIVQLLGGAMVLGFRTNAPNVTNDFGVMPAAVWSSMEVGHGPAQFRLSKVTDGDLVMQAWFAWILPIAVSTVTLTTAGPGELIVPDGAAAAAVFCCGGGGGGRSADAVSGLAGGGGGGGAWAHVTALAVNPGDTLTYDVGAGAAVAADGGLTWLSNTGIAPVNATEGALADFGRVSTGVFPSGGGDGGADVNCIGNSSFSGGRGGNGEISGLLGYSGGGGGGGFDVIQTLPIVHANNGGGGGHLGGGTGGTIGGGDGGSAGAAFGPQDGVDGDTGGGGGGGGRDGIRPDGLGAGGGDGWLIVEYNSIGVAPTPIVTVLESFDDNPQNVETDKQFTVTLPRLSPAAILALRSLQNKISGGQADVSH